MKQNMKLEDISFSFLSVIRVTTFFYYESSTTGNIASADN